MCRCWAPVKVSDVAGVPAHWLAQVPDAPSRTQPGAVDRGRKSGAEALRLGARLVLGAWRVAAAIFRWADGLLRAVAGEGNASFHKLLRLVAVVVLVGLVFAILRMAPRLVGSVNGSMLVDLGSGVTLEMVPIPAGEFMMGSEEERQHLVRITEPFYLGKYEVTQQQWKAVTGDNPSMFEGPSNPVEQVTCDDCEAFLAKLNEQHGGSGWVFRLPTEAEWEYACRAGSITRWCFGDEEASLGEYAWYRSNSGHSAHPVGVKKPNAWGLYDMHGNVSEWCGPTSLSSPVYRGGCWGSSGRNCRSTWRYRIVPSVRSHDLGFRVAAVASGGSG